jgi:urease subunit beta
MKPGEILTTPGDIELNAERVTRIMDVANTGDRPIQVGSHFPFTEVNSALTFDRQSALNMRLDIPAGTAVRFEPGEEKPVQLVEIGGTKQVFGGNRRTENLGKGTNS